MQLLHLYSFMSSDVHVMRDIKLDWFQICTKSYDSVHYFFFPVETDISSIFLLIVILKMDVLALT